MKKVLSLLLILSLLLTSTMVFANEGSKEQEAITPNNEMLLNVAIDFLEGAKLNPVEYGISEINPDSLYIGNEIPVYRSEDSIISFNDEYTIRPIFMDNEIIALINIAKTSTGESYSIGKDFSEELNVALETIGAKKYALVFDETSVSLVSGKNNVKLYEFRFNIITNRVESISRKAANTKSEVVSTTAIKPIIKIDFNSSDLNQNKDVMSTRSGYPSYKVLSVPSKLQGSYNNCWAAVVASIGQFFTGTNKSAIEVCDDAGIGYDDGATLLEMKDEYLSQYNLAVTHAGGALTSSSIAYIINENVPISAAFAGGSLGHAVAIVGYSTSSSAMGLKLMDPNYSSYRSSYHDGTSYTINLNGVTMHYFDSLY